MTTESIIDLTRLRLKAEGFDGLYVPGECGCLLSDLAPCGSEEPGRDGGYINDCEPGYCHFNPKSPVADGNLNDWLISSSKKTPREFIDPDEGAQ